MPKPSLPINGNDTILPTAGRLRWYFIHYATENEAPTFDKNKDIDFGWFLLEIITFIFVITSIIWWGVYVGKEILEL